MKYLISIQNLLLENVQSYEFELTSDGPKMVKYEFEDVVGNKYLVEFKNIPIRRSGELSHVYELLYYVFNEGNYSVSKVVNVNPYRILQTVFGDILKDFAKRCPWATEIYFVGLGKDREREFITSRTKIYRRYLDMNPPVGFIISQSGNNIKITRK